MTENKSFSFNSAKVRFVSSKEQYGSIVCYFVIDHEKTKSELNKIIEEYKECKLPLFVSNDTGDIVIKVKEKFIKNVPSLELKMKYKCNIEFENYVFNDSEGFYLKMDAIQPTTYNSSPEKRKITNINN